MSGVRDCLLPELRHRDRHRDVLPLVRDRAPARL